MPFKGRDGGTWKDASAVYGRSGGSWLYGKSAWAKKNGVWERAWTDCRKYDEAGGRDWSSPSTVTTYSGSCGSRQRIETTTRTKDGCSPDVRVVTVADPTCEGSCTVAQTSTFTQGGVEYYYTGPAGYYEAFLDGDGPAGGCADCSSGYFNYGYYYITMCNGVRTIQVLFCNGCRLY